MAEIFLDFVRVIGGRRFLSWCNVWWRIGRCTVHMTSSLLIFVGLGLGLGFWKVLDTTSEDPHSLFVQIVTVFVPIVTKYT